MDVVIVGAGIVGVCCAVALRESGHRVTVLDRDEPGNATSFGAAGNLGGNAQVAIPGIIWKIPFMLADPHHPFALRWRDAFGLRRWLDAYRACAAPGPAAAISQAAGALGAGVFDAYAALLDGTGAAGMVTKHGRLFVWSTEAGWQKDQYGLEHRRRRGIALTELTGAQVREMEPALGPIVQRGVYAPDAGHIVNPHRFVIVLADKLRAMGGAFRRETVRGIALDADGRPRIATDAGEHAPDLVVLAAGIWSRDLATSLGLTVPLVAERGYHVMLPRPGIAMRVSALWEERKMIVTPMEHGVRASGIAEFAVHEAPPRWSLAERIANSAKLLVPGLHMDGHTRWMGRRPVTPDYLPVIGPAPRSARVLFAFGHGHSGFNLAPATACIVAALASGRTPNIDIAPFRGDRFAAA